MQAVFTVVVSAKPPTLVSLITRTLMRCDCCLLCNSFCQYNGVRRIFNLVFGEGLLPIFDF